MPLMVRLTPLTGVCAVVTPVALAAWKARFDHPPIGIEHAHGVRAPGLAHAGRCANGQLKTGIAHGEILGPVVKAAESAGPGGHAPSEAAAFFEQSDVVSGLAQGACTSDAGHADADDGGVLCGHAPTLHRARTEGNLAKDFRFGNS